jgi:hypothetical protein
MNANNQILLLGCLLTAATHHNFGNVSTWAAGAVALNRT